MQLPLDPGLVKAVAYVPGRSIQLFTERLTKSSASADGALEQAVMSTGDVLNSFKTEYRHYVGSQMAVRLSALRAGRTFNSRNIPGTHFC
jgi:hypothetical protein